MKLDMAMQEYSLQNFQQAAKVVEQCLEVDPDVPAAHLLHGKLLLAQGQPEQAEPELRTALRLNEKLHEPWYWLGVLAQQKRDYEQAQICYSTAMSMSPLEVDYILAVVEVYVALDRCDDAEALLQQKIAALPENVSLMITAADLMLRQGYNQKATRLYTRAARLRPQDNDVAESLAYCHILCRRWKEAAAIFDKLAVNCTDVDQKKTFLQMLAISNMNAAQYNRAQSYYSRLSVEETDDADIWFQMGQAALGSGTAQKAFVCSQRALKLKPDWPDAMVLEGCAQYMLKNYTAALKTFQGVTKSRENAALIWLMEGRCHQKLGNVQRARLAYEKSLKLKPSSELALLLANATSSTGRSF
jgi:Flp pilus assembly protein TadD